MGSARSFIAFTGLLAQGLLLACAQSEEPSRDHWTDVTDSTEVRLVREPEPPCEDCITLERVLVMGDTVGEGFLEAAFHMVRDSLGNHWFGQYDAVKVFDAAGNFVGEVGRAGEGPLEWGSAMPVHTDRRGRVHIFDMGNNRHSVVGPDFTLLEEERLPGGREYRALGDGERWVVNMWHPPGAARGEPLVILQGEEIVRSLGGMSALANDRTASTQPWRIITTDSANRIFSSRWYRYEIDVWSEAGRRITGFIDPTFNDPPFDPESPEARDNPPTNTIRALRVDSEDRLWVLSWKRRDDWLDMMEERRGPDGRVSLEMKPGLGTIDRFESRIDVIDLSSATVLARTRMEGVAVDFLGDDALWAGEFVGAGHLRVGIWKIGFSG